MRECRKAWLETKPTIVSAPRGRCGGAGLRAIESASSGRIEGDSTVWDEMNGEETHELCQICCERRIRTEKVESAASNAHVLVRRSPRKKLCSTHTLRQMRPTRSRSSATAAHTCGNNLSSTENTSNFKPRFQVGQAKEQYPASISPLSRKWQTFNSNVWACFMSYAKGAGSLQQHSLPQLLSSFL